MKSDKFSNWETLPIEEWEKFNVIDVLVLVEDPFGDRYLLKEDNAFFSFDRPETTSSK